MGKTARQKADHIVEVAIGALIARQGNEARLLIARRSQDQVLGGYWELPGGKREAGETLAQCLQREFMEELTIRVTVGRLLAVVEHAYDHATVRLHAFLCTLEEVQGSRCKVQNSFRREAPRSASPATPPLPGGAMNERRWITAAELDDYRFPPANDRLMEAIRGELRVASR